MALRAAAVLGGLVAAIYLIALPTLDDGVVVAIVSLAVMVTSASLAWWAARTARRWVGYIAGLGFFVLGVFSTSLLAAIFLAAALLCVVGTSAWAGAR